MRRPLFLGWTAGMIEEELLPFVETVRARRHLAVVRRDPGDNRFLECAVAGRARYLVTGGQDLRELGSYRGVIILTVGEFLKQTGLHGDSGS
jgi:predicted nucleic acid-binding protein